MAAKLIFFVCISNTCRSPMCEYMFRDKVEKMGLSSEFAVASRSLSEDYEPQGSPANEQGQLVMLQEYGINTSGHRSKLLSADDVEQAYLVIPVKRELGEYIKKAFPRHASKVKYLTQDVTDPWRQPYVVYAKCALLIESLMTAILAEISGTSQKDSSEL